MPSRDNGLRGQPPDHTCSDGQLARTNP